MGSAATFTALRRAPRVRRGLLAVARLESPPPPQVAYAISRRVGGAVARNRLRRRLRALAVDAHLRSGTWLVIAAPGAAEASFTELRHWWTGCVEALEPPLA